MMKRLLVSMLAAMWLTTGMAFAADTSPRPFPGFLA